MSLWRKEEEKKLPAVKRSPSNRPAPRSTNYGDGEDSNLSCASRISCCILRRAQAHTICTKSYPEHLTALEEFTVFTPSFSSSSSLNVPQAYAPHMNVLWVSPVPLWRSLRYRSFDHLMSEVGLLFLTSAATRREGAAATRCAGLSPTLYWLHCRT